MNGDVCGVPTYCHAFNRCCRNAVSNRKRATVSLLLLLPGHGMSKRGSPRWIGLFRRSNRTATISGPEASVTREAASSIAGQ